MTTLDSGRPSSAKNSRRIKLTFVSYHPYREETIEDFARSDKNNLAVYCVPHAKGPHVGLIEWDCGPCGLRLSAEAIHTIESLNEDPFKNPWIPDVGAYGGTIKCPPKSLAEWRKTLRNIFTLSKNWTNEDGSEFTGEVKAAELGRGVL